MKFFNFVWEYKYIIIPIFLWIGVFLDYAHIYLNLEKEYVGVSYGVEVNFSVLYNLIFNTIKGVIYGI
ncbi:hypothetical protein [Sulfurimonas sp.]